MLKRAKQRARKGSGNKPAASLTATSLSNMQHTATNGDTANFLSTTNDPTVIERVRCTIKYAHVFKLPTRQAASAGWRGADWKEKVWQGSVKVVDRNDITAVLLVERSKNENGNTADSIFAVCPIQEGAIERCVDSSRYFVLRIENQSGKHMFIGLAFNERNDAFDFNTSLQDARREREFESTIENDPNEFSLSSKPAIDYSLKEGEKIKVAIHSSKKDGNNDFFNIGADGGGTAAFANFQLDSPESTMEPTEQKAKPKGKFQSSNEFCKKTNQLQYLMTFFQPDYTKYIYSQGESFNSVVISWWLGE